MIQHLINKEAEKDDNDYSIYQNPDKELQKEIQDFVANYNPTTVDLGWPRKTWDIVEQEGDEYKLQSGRDIKYESVETVNKALEDGLKNAINSKFITGKHFGKCFGTLYDYKKGHYASLKILRITDVIDLTDENKFPADKYPNNIMRGRTFNNDDLLCYQSEFEYQMDSYKKIGIKVSPGVCGMFLSFTKEGNFRNRNYNENLNYYSNDVVDPAIMLEELLTEIRNSIGDKKLEKSPKGNSYYADDFMYFPYFYEEHRNYCFGVEKIRVRHDGKSYQNGSGYQIYKKPAKVEETNVETLINEMLSSIPKEGLDLFNLEYVLNYVYDFS